MTTEFDDNITLSELADGVAPKKATASAGPKVGLTHTFTVVYNGQRYEFTSMVPTIGARIKHGQVVAQMIGQTNYAALPFETRALVEAIAKCSVHLVNKPDWFEKLLQSHTPQAVYEIAAEVDRHHSLWFLQTVGVDSDGVPRPVLGIEGGLGTAL